MTAMSSSFEPHYEVMQQQPMNAAMMGERVTALLQLTQSLTRVIDEENRLLRNRKPREIKKLAEEKSRLSMRYDRELRLLRTHKGLLDGTDRNLRIALRDATQNFHKALDANRRILLRMRKVGEGLINAIGEEVARQNRPVQNYGQNARMDNRSNSPTTLALNQTI